jgi:formate dehydrogenase (coenzyme F420) beta subunit
MSEELRQTCRCLLEEGTVQVVIGYGRPRADGPTVPVFITRAADCEQLVWNDRCYFNLTVYLSRKEIRALGKPAIVVKGCDERALVVLEKESQIVCSEIVVLGMACEGVGRPRLRKCEACDVRMPRRADHVIGQSPADGRPAQTDHRYAEVEAFLQKSPEERMAYWKAELARCVKCYACRRACPICYCNQCITEKNRPVAISTSATLKGNFAWQITRAFHLAGRCVGCNECARACPAGIDLQLLNLSLARAAEENFAFRAGMDPEAEPVIGTYSQEDRGEFIR